jgi:hypothetical protein
MSAKRWRLLFGAALLTASLSMTGTKPIEASCVEPLCWDCLALRCQPTAANKHCECENLSGGSGCMAWGQCYIIP